jgi:aspartate/tyrosine/aromatic aminotransferase
MATANTQTKKTGNTVEAAGDVKVTLPDAKRGLYGVVGAADYAVEQIKALPRYQGAVVDALRGVPQQLRTSLTDLQGKVNETYSEFANRGEKVVSSIRKDPQTQAALEQTKTAKTQVKAARTSVKKAASETGAATEKAGDKIG